LMGIHDVSAFMAFSKSESRSTSRRAWMRAALVAWRMSSPVAGGGSFSSAVVPVAAGSVPGLGPVPSRRNTSHTRSCAGKGIDRLNSVRYHRVPYAVLSTQSSDCHARQPSLDLAREVMLGQGNSPAWLPRLCGANLSQTREAQPLTLRTLDDRVDPSLGAATSSPALRSNAPRRNSRAASPPETPCLEHTPSPGYALPSITQTAGH